MREKKPNFANVVIGIDIETSTIEIDAENKCSFMYSFCVSSLDFNTGIYNEIALGRTYRELSDILYNLNEKAENDEKTTIVYIHNLSYEFSFFSNNVDFFKDKLEHLDFNECIFKSKNKPLFLRLGNLEFRCSLSLLSKSIKKIGKEIGLEKLDFDYDKLRTPLTELDPKEIEYNFRDVEIMLKGVYLLYKNNVYMKSTNDIPYTKTGVMRFNCEHNPEINTTEEYQERKTRKVKKRKLAHLNNWICSNEKAKTHSQLRFWESLFQGGFVYSNPKCCHQVLQNVGSFDFASDYPYQMLYRYYPSNFKQFEGDKTRKLKSIMAWLDYEDLIDAKISNNMFNAIVVIDKIKAKYNFQPLATSKIINIKDLKNGLNCEVINGKVFECETPVKMYVTIIDMLMLKLFYDYEIVNCYYLEIASSYSKSNKYKLNCVSFNAKAKIEFKKYNNLVEGANTYKKYGKSEIENDMFREQINACENYFEQLTTSNQMYQNVKSDLNALYGDNAQHLMRTNYIYDLKARDYIEKNDTFEDYEKSRCKTSYIYGVYVPQFARASIFYIIYVLLENGYDILYVDTDSVKVKYDKNVDKIIDEFNKKQLENLGDFRWTGFGVLEREYVADKFSSLGTKSYIKQEGEIIKATISGLPNATEHFNKLFELFDRNFDEMVEMCYHYGTVFDINISRKLASKYKFNTYEIDIDGYKDIVTSGVVLEPVEVTMRDFLSPVWESYARLICLKYNYRFSDFCFDTRIFINGKGETDFEI